ncbi:MAG: right-handed parallel beta-helix repeat-containing protein [Pseudomonadota bacterium]
MRKRTTTINWLARRQGQSMAPIQPRKQACVVLSFVGMLCCSTAQAQIPVTSCQTLGTAGNYVLTGNLSALGGSNCIKVWDDDVTFDLNGYKIVGSGAGAGIYVRPTVTGVKLMNGAIERFNHAVNAQSASVSIVGLTARHHTSIALWLGTSSRVVDSLIENNGTGITAGANAKILRNTIRVHSALGIYCGDHSGPGSCTIENNSIDDSGIGGIRTIGGSHDIVGNYVSGSPTGILVIHSGNLVRNNRLVANGGGLSTSRGSQTVIGNLFFDNSGRGALVKCPSLVTDNHATANGGTNLQYDGVGCLTSDNLVQ